MIEKQEGHAPATSPESPIVMDALLSQQYCCVICSVSVAEMGLFKFLIYPHLSVLKPVLNLSCLQNCCASKVALLTMGSISLNGIYAILRREVSAA